MTVRRVPAAMLLAAWLAVSAPASPDPTQDPGSRSLCGWMGVRLARVGGSAGALEITGVAADGPAEQAGLRARDRIVTVGGKPAASIQALLTSMRETPPGTLVSVAVERGDDTREFRVRLAACPDDESSRPVRRGWIGVRSIDLPPGLREHFGATREAGVMVSEVVPGSPAEAAGFRLGDVICEAGGLPVRGPIRLENRVRSAGVGNNVDFVVLRDGKRIVLRATVDEEPPPSGALLTSGTP